MLQAVYTETESDRESDVLQFSPFVALFCVIRVLRLCRYRYECILYTPIQIGCSLTTVASHLHTT